MYIAICFLHIALCIGSFLPCNFDPCLVGLFITIGSFKALPQVSTSGFNTDFCQNPNTESFLFLPSRGNEGTIFPLGNCHSPFQGALWACKCYTSALSHWLQTLMSALPEIGLDWPSWLFKVKYISHLVVCLKPRGTHWMMCRKVISKAVSLKWTLERGSGMYTV